MASTILRIDYVRLEAVQASLEVLVDERGFRTGRGAHTDESEHKLDSPILPQIRSTGDSGASQ